MELKLPPLHKSASALRKKNNSDQLHKFTAELFQIKVMQRRLVTVNSTKDANWLFAQINLQHDIIYNKISPSERMHALSSARRAVVND